MTSRRESDLDWQHDTVLRYRLMRRQSDSLGLNLEKRPPAVTVTFRLLGPDVLKLDALAAQLVKSNPRVGKVGRSKMARLIVEKFISEHDPNKKEKR